MTQNNRKTGLLLTYATILVNMVCGLLLSSFLLRTLGDFEYGLYHAIGTFISYLVILEFGVGTVLCRNLLVAEKSQNLEERKKITSTAWYISLFLSVIILMVSMVFYANIENIYHDTIPPEYINYARQLFIVLLVYLLASFLLQTISGSFLGNENYNMDSWIRLVSTLSRTLILVVAISSVQSSMVIVITDAAIKIIALAFSVYYVRKHYDFSMSIRHFDWQLLKTSLPLCCAFLLQTLINQANNQISTFIVSIKMSMECVALYSITMYVYMIFTSMTTIPVGIYMPQVAQNIGNGILGKALMETLVPSGRLIALVGGTILFGFIAVGAQFVDIVYGEHFHKAWLLAIIIMISSFLHMTGGGAVNVLNVLNKRLVRSYLMAVTAILNILFTLCLIETWGLITVSIATSISIFVGSVILMNIYYYRAFSLNIYELYIKSYKGILLSELIAMLGGGGIGMMIANKYLAFLCGGFTFILLEVGCLWWFGLNPSERNALTLAMQKIKLRLS